MEEETYRVPVPDYIRTRRAAPRIIATLTLLGWLALFASSGSALSGTDANPTLWAQPIAAGYQAWKVSAKDQPGQAAGIFDINLETGKSESRLVSSGLFRLNVLGNVTVVTLKSTAAFDPLRELNDFKFKADLKSATGGGLVEAQFGPRDKPAIVKVKSGPISQEFTLPYPGRIYLTAVGKNQYRIHLPAQLRALLEQATSSRLSVLAASAVSSEESTDLKRKLSKTPSGTSGSSEPALSIDSLPLDDAAVLKPLLTPQPKTGTPR